MGLVGVTTGWGIIQQPPGGWLQWSLWLRPLYLRLQMTSSKWDRSSFWPYCFQPPGYRLTCWCDYSHRHKRETKRQQSVCKSRGEVFLLLQTQWRSQTPKPLNGVTEVKKAVRGFTTTDDQFQMKPLLIFWERRHAAAAAAKVIFERISLLLYFPHCLRWITVRETNRDGDTEAATLLHSCRRESGSNEVLLLGSRFEPVGFLESNEGDVTASGVVGFSPSNSFVIICIEGGRQPSGDFCCLFTHNAFSRNLEMLLLDQWQRSVQQAPAPWAQQRRWNPDQSSEGKQTEKRRS